MSSSFATTRWTLVLDAARHGNANTGDTAAGRALGELCALYRAPLLAHARRRGLPPADAEDAVQGLLAALLRRDSLASARHERGRFRSWLLGAFEHHLADQRARARAAKRGGAADHVADPASALEVHPSPEPAPDAAYDRAWALALLEAATARLRAEHAAAGRADWFDTLAPALAGRSAEAPHADLAARLALSEPALRVALHRLRHRFRAVLREEVAHTVADPAEIDAELRHLLAALSG